MALNGETRKNDSWEEQVQIHLDAIETIKPRNFIVHTGQNGLRSGLWGELLSVAAQKRDVVRAIIDDLVRDSQIIKKQGFPVWCQGDTAADAFGRSYVDVFSVPDNFSEVRIEPGDALVANFESVARLKPKQPDEVLERAESKFEDESLDHERLQNGDSVLDVIHGEGKL